MTVFERPTVSTSEGEDGPGDWPGHNPGDHAAGVGTTGCLALNDGVSGTANAFDLGDWYWVYLEAGTRYQFEMAYRCEGFWWGCGTACMPRMLIRDDDGKTPVGLSADHNDDILADRRFYTPERTGMYLLEAWSELRTAYYTWNFGYTLDFTEAPGE